MTSLEGLIQISCTCGKTNCFEEAEMEKEGDNMTSLCVHCGIKLSISLSMKPILMKATECTSCGKNQAVPSAKIKENSAGMVAMKCTMCSVAFNVSLSAMRSLSVFGRFDMAALQSLVLATNEDRKKKAVHYFTCVKCNASITVKQAEMRSAGGDSYNTACPQCGEELNVLKSDRPLYVTDCTSCGVQCEFEKSQLLDAGNGMVQCTCVSCSFVMTIMRVKMKIIFRYAQSGFVTAGHKGIDNPQPEDIMALVDGIEKEGPERFTPRKSLKDGIESVVDKLMFHLDSVYSVAGAME